MLYTRHYYNELDRVFYTNLRVREHGYLYNEVNGMKIKITLVHWLTVCNLKYYGRKLSFLDIFEDMDYDQHMALRSMVRPKFQCHNAGVRSLEGRCSPEDTTQIRPESNHIRN